MPSTTTTILRYILTFQLLLGGQSRLTPLLTPSLHTHAMAKAAGHQRFLYPITRIRDPVRNEKFIGGLMCVAGALLLLTGKGRMRLCGGVLAISLTMAGVYSQYRMGVPWWLPAVNTVLAGCVMWDEVGAGR